MKIHAAGRQWGKTTFLIRKSVETGKTIVVPNEEMVRAIVMRADALRLTIPYPITFREFISKGYYGDSGYLIDELQSCLRQLNITDATLDIEAIEYLPDPNGFIREKIYGPVEESKQKERYSIAIRRSLVSSDDVVLYKLRENNIKITKDYFNNEAHILETSTNGLIVLVNDSQWFVSNANAKFDRVYGFSNFTRKQHSNEYDQCEYDEDALSYIIRKEKEIETMNKPKRISKSEYYLNIAKAVAQRSTCIRRQYGAVIVKNDEIIATGYNGSARGEENCCDIGTCWRERNNIPHGQQYEKCVAVHAEQNAIISAPRDKLLGSTIYIYGEENGKTIEARPCEICHRMILNAGIENVVLSEPGDDTTKTTDEEIKEVDPVSKSFIRNIAEKIEESGLENVRVSLSFEPYKYPMCAMTVNEIHPSSAGSCGCFPIARDDYRMCFDPLYEGFEDLDRMIARDIDRGLNKILEKTTQK